MNYKLYKYNKDTAYSCFLLCLSIYSIVNFISELETSSLIKNKTGKLIIDQITLTGNSNNRYIECSFQDGHIDINSCKKLKVTDDIKKFSLNKIKANSELLENSIIAK